MKPELCEYCSHPRDRHDTYQDYEPRSDSDGCLVFIKCADPLNHPRTPHASDCVRCPCEHAWRIVETCEWH